MAASYPQPGSSSDSTPVAYIGPTAASSAPHMAPNPSASSVGPSGSRSGSSLGAIPMRSHKPSISDAFYPGSTKQGGRNFYFGSLRNTLDVGSPAIHSQTSVREQTAELASFAIDDSDLLDVPGSSDGFGALPAGSGSASATDTPAEFRMPRDRRRTSNAETSALSSLLTGSNGPLPALPSDTPPASLPYLDSPTLPPSPHSETAPLLASHPTAYGSDPTVPEDITDDFSPAPNGKATRSLTARIRAACRLDLSPRNVAQQCIVQPARYIPSVLLGVLLNILDGLSYGMIMFPVGSTVFANLGPTGLSMFYVSCILSQLVYSLGGSAFHSGIGSEMIEVTPFFHGMALSVVEQLGADRPHEVIATTILAFAVSSVVTGMVFFALGAARLGALIGFFPRHILVGCIGGVGWFLVVTGVEVCSRMSGSLEYSWDTVAFLFSSWTVALKWLLPLAVAVVLLGLQRISRNALLVPTYFLAVFLCFHIAVAAVPAWDLPLARKNGWVFAAPNSAEPWYSFYKLYDFSAVDWHVLLSLVPDMFALTFFGILHVPINVPALAVSIGMDNVDVDRELVAHGVSNVLSGLCGSVQNYLVYTNSVLFIRSGADSRLAGVMLAAGTAAVMSAGPVVVGFIPVVVVGALIYLLGIELLQEALVDTWGRLHPFEYLTIVVIVVTMGAWDFVYGILVGILLACVSFVVGESRRSAIAATYTGAVARSTVRRHPLQQKFLREVGNQIYVLRLSGTIFFGTIVEIEKTVRGLFEGSYFSEKPIRYLVLDMQSVKDIDFSAAEAFIRFKRLVASKQAFLVISSVKPETAVLTGLEAAGFWDGSGENRDVELFDDLNSALEWCENEFLSTYYRHREALAREREREREQEAREKPTAVPAGSQAARQRMRSVFEVAGSPRHSLLQQAAKSTVTEATQLAAKLQQYRQPLPLIMTALQAISDKPAAFWAKLCDLLVREEVSAGTELYKADLQPGRLYFLESGLLQANYELEQGRLYEPILPGTCVGEMLVGQGLLSSTLVAQKESVVWTLDWAALQAEVKKNPKGYELENEILLCAIKLLNERFNSLTGYVMISAD